MSDDEGYDMWQEDQESKRDEEAYQKARKLMEWVGFRFDEAPVSEVHYPEAFKSGTKRILVYHPTPSATGAAHVLCGGMPEFVKKEIRDFWHPTNVVAYLTPAFDHMAKNGFGYEVKVHKHGATAVFNAATPVIAQGNNHMSAIVALATMLTETYFRPYPVQT